MAMSVENNRKLARAWLDAVSRGELDLSLASNDCRWWVPGIGSLDRESFLEVAGPFSELLDGPLIMTVTAMTAEDDRVAVEAEGEGMLTDGRIYANTYHFLMRVRDGKICEIREHHDTLVPYELFGHLLPQRTEAAGGSEETGL